jgi:hypothetical protein
MASITVTLAHVQEDCRISAAVALRQKEQRAGPGVGACFQPRSEAAAARPLPPIAMPLRMESPLVRFRAGSYSDARRRHARSRRTRRRDDAALSIEVQLHAGNLGQADRQPRTAERPPSHTSSRSVGTSTGSGTPSAHTTASPCGRLPTTCPWPRLRWRSAAAARLARSKRRSS